MNNGEDENGMWHDTTTVPEQGFLISQFYDTPPEWRNLVARSYLLSVIEFDDARYLEPTQWAFQ